MADYAALMRELFDFDALSKLFASGFRMRFDALSAVTGPYAKAILEGALGAAAGTVVNVSPSPISAATTPIRTRSMPMSCTI